MSVTSHQLQLQDECSRDPAGQATGSYTVYLQAPSSYSTAQTRPFMVRFANANSGAQQWDDINGRMASGTKLTVN